MSFYHKKAYILSAILLTFGTLIFISFLFSCIFYFFPLKSDWLMLASDLAIAFAVFSGSFYLRAINCQFKIKSLFILILITVSILLTVNILFGEVHFSELLSRILIILIAAISGCLFGR